MKLNLDIPKNKPFDAVGLGLVAMDHLIVVPHFPHKNKKMRLLHYEMQGGGQIGTGFVTLSRLGLKVKFLGKVGGDELGDISLQLLKNEGVDVSDAVQVPDATSQYAFILVDKTNGERTIIWHRHPDLSFKPGDFSKEAVTAGKILHLDGHEVPFSIQAARWAKEEGIPILLDAERLKDRTLELLPYADIIIADENFATLVCPEKDHYEFLQHIQKEYNPRFCGITEGEQGSLGLFEGDFIHVPAYEVDVVDSTGAGDLYHAAFLYGALQNWNVMDIMRFATAVAGMKCRFLGGRKGAPTLDEVVDFMGEEYPG